MLRKVILAKLASVERELGESVDYVRHIVGVSLPAFFKFAKVFPLADYRRRMPEAPLHVARIVASRDEDCGTCVQIALNVARKAGVSREVLQAVLDRAPERLPEELALTYRFTEAVVTASGGEAPLREELTRRFGEEGVIELALAMASSRVFPITKRALGYATSCSAMTLEVGD